MKQLQRNLLSTAVLVALAACGGGKENAAPKAEQTSVSISGTKLALPTSFTVVLTDADRDIVSLTQVKEGTTVVAGTNSNFKLSNGLLFQAGVNKTLEKTEIKFVFIPSTDADASLSLQFTDGKDFANVKVDLAGAASDPLFAQQWHLHNTGQKAYALSDAYKEFLYEDLLASGVPPQQATEILEAYWQEQLAKLVPGEDMNVLPAYAKGVTGKGAIAVVVDSGLEIAHEDLQANILPNRSLNLVDGALNPTDPTSTAVDGDHGTSVGGLIAAVGWNGKGGHGVAPEAQLIGMNYLEAQTDLAFMLSHGIIGSGIGENENVAVFNRSYGITYPTSISYDEFEEAVQENTAYLRGGKGSVNTKSSGNSFVRGSSSRDGSLCRVNGANALGLSCYNANMESSQSSPYSFSIGAVNSDGKHTSYSTAGANLVAVAPSGEYGDDAPAMVTTDQMTCLRGYSSFASWDFYDSYFGPGYFEAAYPFNTPGHPDNLSCNYTSSFNGTSSAAPNAAGVVTLILSANPNLGMRDVRHILASTSTKVDPDNAPVKLAIGDAEFVAHDGWVKNKAGYSHNNLYGFGRVNAGKAVEMAMNYKANLGEFVLGEWQGVGAYGEEGRALANAIPDNSAVGATVSVDVADAVTLEGVQFMFQVANPEMNFANVGGFHTTAGSDLAIEVTSPSGTRSVVLTSRQALIAPAVGANWHVGYILKDSVMLSNAFYGESAKGTWTFRFLDTNGKDLNTTGGLFQVKGYKNNVAPSVVEGVAVRVFGH